MKNSIIVVLILILVSTGLQAEDIFVQAGNNTITTALATAEPGDVLVLVEEGIYANDPLFIYEPITIRAWESLTSKPVVSYLWGEDAATISEQEKTLVFTYASLTLEGLEITMEGDTALTNGITTRMFRNRAFTGVNWNFSDCLFRDASQATMSITGVVDTFMVADGSYYIDGVDYVDNDGVVIDGVTVATDGEQGVLDTLIIDNCVFNNFLGGATKINHAPAHGRGVYYYSQFTNNTVFNIDHHALQIRMRDVDEGNDLSLYGQAVIDHNTFHIVGGSGRNAVFLKYVHTTSYITNTTMSETSGKPFNVLNAEAVLIDYSNWFGYGQNPPGGSTVNIGDNNLEVDPLFVDGPNGDLTLQAESPLIGAGEGGSNIGDPRWDPTAVSVDDDSPVIMDGYSLRQNYPNPFNPVTEITFTLPIAGDISLKVFNMLGQEVALITSGNYSAGLHKVIFNAAELHSGIYFYQLTGSDLTFTKKMILMK